MTRGTTPTLIFTLPFDVGLIDICSIAFAQKKRLQDPNATVVFEKALSDCELNGNELSLTLSEEDTLLLDSDYTAEVQIRCKVGKTELASQIITLHVGRILKDGCLE